MNTGTPTETRAADALTLYSIHEELQAWSDTLELASTDEERAEIQARISTYLQAGRDKVDRFNQFLSHIDYQIYMCGEEESRIAGRRQQMMRVKKHLESYAMRTLQVLGMKRLEGNTSELALRKNPPSVVVEDESQIPDQYKKAKIEVPMEWLDAVMEILPPGNGPTVAVMKSEIATALKSGEAVAGARLSTDGVSLKRG